MLRLIPSSPRRASRPPSRGDDLLPLVEAVARSERRATRTLVLALGPHLLRVVRRVLGRRSQDLEDVTQEAAYAVLEALPRYRNECSVLHFACRVAVLTAMNARRKIEATKRASAWPVDGGVESVAAAEPGPDSDLSSRSVADAVRSLLGTLPEPQAETLALHCVLGYTVTEIASSSGVPRETVRSRLREARRALREKMKADPMLRDIVEEAP